MSVINVSSNTLFPLPKIGIKTTKVERTYLKILNSAMNLIWPPPFHDITVNSLMVSTGVSRAAFYQYFKDLYELMEALLTLLRVCYERGPRLKVLVDSQLQTNGLKNTGNISIQSITTIITSMSIQMLLFKKSFWKLLMQKLVGYLLQLVWKKEKNLIPMKE
jgi:hypothetical protein